MAYLAQYDETATVDAGGFDAEEAQLLEQGFQQFTAGDMVTAASTLAPLASSSLATSLGGLSATGWGAVIAAGILAANVLARMIGRGRREADIIVPLQNQLINPQGTGQLDQITQVLVHNPNVPALQSMFSAVQRIASAFMEFISDTSRFTDGRASEQAANTIFPYIDGTCGFHWPPPMHPTQHDCLRWGAGTPGGDGTDGMLGALARAILRQGGTVPPLLPTQGPGPYQQLQPQGGQYYPYIPQSGTIPANAPLSPIVPARVPTVAGIGAGVVPALLTFGAAFWLLQKRKS